MTVVASELLRTAGYVDRACPHCGWRFFTTLGLYDHARTCLEDQAHQARVRENLRATGLHVTTLNNSRREACAECGKTSTPAGLALHQRSSGHVGRAELS